MSRLRDLLEDDAPEMVAIHSYLDALGPTERLREVRTLGRAHQARLFDAARGYRAISLDDLVSPDRAPMEEVVHHGKNSLPLFNHFSKVFVRPPESEKPELWGYNRAGGFVETIVGPGYFVAYAHQVAGEVLVDYLRVPPTRPDHWPEILPNSSRLSRFVYDGTQDVLRGVSTHVTIGRATKGRQPMSAWFALCREVPEAQSR
jgi:hypothetical protein